jgi:hypothetical protein
MIQQTPKVVWSGKSMLSQRSCLSHILLSSDTWDKSRLRTDDLLGHNVIPDRSAHPTEALNPSILTTLSKFEAIANSQNLY